MRRQSASTLARRWNSNDYQVLCAFNGAINKLTINLKPAPMSTEEQKQWDEEARRS